MVNNKIESLAVMRVMAMFMIISFHSLCFYTHRWWSLGGVYIPIWDEIATFLNAIDLPMFIFISGYLWSYLYINKGKYKNKKVFILSKTRRLIVPYLFGGIFLIVSMPRLHDWKSLLTGISHLWFLLVLFELFLFIIPIASWICKESKPFLFFSFLVCSYLLFFAYHYCSKHHSFLSIHASLFYLPTFIIGIACARYKIAQMQSILWPIILFIVSVFFLALYVFTARELSYPLNYLLLQLIGVIITVSLLCILNKIHYPTKLYQTILQLGNLSMGIYIFNQISINAFLQIKGVVPFLNVNYRIGPILICAIGFFIPFILSFLFNKIKYIKWTIG